MPSAQALDQGIREVVAVALEQVVGAALELAPHVCHHLVHLLAGHRRLPDHHAFPVHHCRHTAQSAEARTELARCW